MQTIITPAYVLVRPIERISLRERIARLVRGYYVDRWHPAGPIVIATRWSPRIERAVLHEAARLRLAVRESTNVPTR